VVHYNNLANRGKYQKEIILSCMNGDCHIQVDMMGVCNFCIETITHDANEEENSTISSLQLLDLRSRALLQSNMAIYTTGLDSEEASQLKDQMTHFAQLVSDLEHISSVVTALCRSGCLQYRSFQQSFSCSGSSSQMQSLKEETQKQLKIWQKELHQAMKECHFLSFFSSIELWTLVVRVY